MLSSGKLRACTGRHVGFATALVRTLDELLFLDLPEITVLIFTDLYEVLHEVKQLKDSNAVMIRIQCQFEFYERE